MNELMMQYEYIRRTGRVNMRDNNAVVYLATRNGFLQLANAALNNKEYNLLRNTFQQPSDRAFTAWIQTNGLAEPA